MPASGTAEQGDSAGIVGGRYRLERKLGAGGMGAVYLAEDLSSGQLVALKRPRSPEMLRFRREFHTMAGLRHPRIVQVYDYGVDADGPFYTMELLPGQDLSDLGVLEPATVCRVLRDVCSALAFLHGRNLLHRNLSPRNIRLAADGSAKLLDFGVLATTGVIGEVAGTPPLIAPEGLRNLPQDHRSDLFSVGALGYKLLTGQNAYPARCLADLEPTWRARPAAPSTLNPAVPPVLDSLILSLLSLEPLARPASAVEVMERLRAVGGLPALAEAEVARSYLSSAAMVGRQKEVARVHQHIANCVKGRGCSVMIEADVGMGKSRFLREIGLHGQIAGMAVVPASGEEGGRGPYGLMRAVARGLLRICPQQALEAVRPVASLLGHVVTELGERLAPLALARLDGDPADERLRVQGAFVDWILAVSERQPLLLLLDDMQRCDEASSAVLASLARHASEHALLISAARRSHEAAQPIEVLQQASERLRLKGLGAEDVRELVQTLFGEVLYSDRLASWIHAVAAGSPLHTIELAHCLVARQVVRFADGAWTIPPELRVEDVPQGLPAALDLRLQTLSPGARRLAQALSVMGGELQLSFCLELLDGPKEEEVFDHLDELLQHEVLIGTAQRFRFRHEALREALLRSIEGDERRALHLRVAATLAPLGSDREAEVGWHYLRGGEELRGAELLARAGMRLMRTQSMRDAIPLLEAALETYERLVVEPTLRFELRQQLLLAGVMHDRAAVLRHGERALDDAWHRAGLDLSARVARVLGRYLGLALGILWAHLRWALSAARRRGPRPIRALGAAVATAAALAGAYSHLFALDRLRGLLRRMRLLEIVPGSIMHGSVQLCRALLDIPEGRRQAAIAHCEAALRAMQKDRWTPIGELERRGAMVSIHNLLAWVRMTDLDPRYAEHLAPPPEVHLRSFDFSPVIHLMFHRLRGEEEAAQAHRVGIDQLQVQLGSVWIWEALVTWYSSLGFAYCRDMLGLKRSIEQMVRLREDGFQIDEIIELARGEYHRERGEIAQSLAILLGLRSRAPRESIIFQPLLAALAESHCAAGSFGEAAAAATAGIEAARAPGFGMLIYRLRSQRALALALSGGGERARAAAILEEAIAEGAPLGSPSVCGSLHEARALVALASADLSTARTHREQAERWFAATRNPALIARGERLRSAEGPQLTRARRAPTQELVTVEDAAPRRQISSMLEPRATPEERSARALQLLVDAMEAELGYLYLLAADGPRLAAPLGGDEPPAWAETLIRRALLPEVDTATATVETPGAEAGWELVMLWSGWSSTTPCPLGGALLRRPRQPVELDLVAAISQALQRYASSRD